MGTTIFVILVLMIYVEMAGGGAKLYFGLTRTLVPTLLIPRSYPPAPVLIKVTTRAGQELTFTQFNLEPNEYVAFHTESLPQGLPLANGLELKFDLINQVDFGQPSPGWDSRDTSAAWPISLILTNGSKIETSLGFKAHHQLHLTGDSSYGYLDINLLDIERIQFVRAATPGQIPFQPASGPTLSVFTTDDSPIRVSNPKIFARCMFEVYCCHDETITALPLKDRPDLGFDTFSAVVLDSTESVRVTTLDGQIKAASLRPSTACVDTPWRLRGKTERGDFEIELGSVKKIEP
jgi:hypothetical protein